MDSMHIMGEPPLELMTAYDEHTTRCAHPGDPCRFAASADTQRAQACQRCLGACAGPDDSRHAVAAATTNLERPQQLRSTLEAVVERRQGRWGEARTERGDSMS